MGKAIKIHLLFLIAVMLLPLGLMKASDGHPLYQLELRLMKGQQQALFEIAGYLDSETKLDIYLGWHHIKSTEASVARRILEENCMFLETEVKINYKLNTAAFLDFLNKNKRKIHFSDLAEAFIITPFQKRHIEFKIEELTEYSREFIGSRSHRILNYYWIQNSEIKHLIETRNPKALLLLCSELLKGRHRWNMNQWNTNEYMEALQLLTNCRIGVKNEKNKISYDIERDFEPESRINLLIFMEKHYNGYSWDNELKIFRNSKLSVSKPAELRIQFEKLFDDDKDLAMESFISLSKSDPAQVDVLCAEFEDPMVFIPYPLPSNTFRILPQLARFTKYCRNLNIDYLGNAEFRLTLDSLKRYRFPYRRFQFENSVLSHMQLTDLAPLEYWTIVYSYGSGDLSRSAGRILDKFYSIRWQEVCSDSSQLKLYLKKIALFKRLGLHGICENYFKKFLGSDPDMVGRLKSIHSNDSDVIEVKQALLAVIIQSPKALISKEKSHRGNQDYPRPNFSNLLDSIILNEDDSLKATRQIKILISKITYDQIGLVIRELDSRSIKFSSYSYAFVSRDFGLEVPFLFSDSNRIKFLKLHETLSEQELYKYYLNLKGVNFETNSQLDFQKIYQILKFDITTPFARGASGIETNHVYAIIKVLELEFETSLGYPKKLCNSDSYSCSCYGRAYSWMSYLEQYGLVILNPGEAPSFSYPLSHDFKFMSR